MCSVLEVHRSGYYAWYKTSSSKREKKDQELLEAIRASYKTSRGVYGSPRVHRDLMAQEIRCGRKRVARLMRANQMVALRGYKTPRFRGGKPSTAAPNIVDRQFKVDHPNKVWVTDITYIRCQKDWIYLAAIIDLCSRKVISWSLGPKMHTGLVLSALQKAIRKRKPPIGLVLHSDQGCQFGSDTWIRYLNEHGIKQSMSRRGNCHDNAVNESFFSSLKMERIRRQSYSSLDQARSDIFDYIEMFYNPVRRHSSLGYLSPNQFEERF